MQPTDKDLKWVPAALAFVRTLGEKDRDRIGTALRVVQQGGHPPSAKALSHTGSTNVREIRCPSADGTYRVIYTIEHREAIWVVDAFQKKSKHSGEVPNEDLARIKIRLRQARELNETYYGKGSKRHGTGSKPN